MKVRIIFKTYDSWVGAFKQSDWKMGTHKMYVFLLPIIGFRFEWKAKNPNSTSFWYIKFWTWYWDNFGAFTIFILIMLFWAWIIDWTLVIETFK